MARFPHQIFIQRHSEPDKDLGTEVAIVLGIKVFPRDANT